MEDCFKTPWCHLNIFGCGEKTMSWCFISPLYTLWKIRLWCSCCLPSPLGSCSKEYCLHWRWALTSICIVVPLPFWHKLNYFLFCQTFEKKKIVCVEILINLKVQLLGFELQTLCDHNFKLSQSKHIPYPQQNPIYYFV
jgi:hypothetical protein